MQHGRERQAQSGAEETDGLGDQGDDEMWRPAL